MLDKLLKYEFKATARLFGPLYLTILAFAMINRFLFPLYSVNENASALYKVAMSISMVVYVTLMIGLVVMTLFVMIQRFYKNLLSDEGYLMFTLPVQTWKHIFSKLTVSTLWTIISGIVAIFSVVIISSRTIPTKELFKDMLMAFAQTKQYFGTATYWVGLEGIVLFLLSIASTILTIYAAIALGHLFNKHKLLASFGMYIVLKTVSQIIMSISAVVFFSMPIFKPGTEFIPSVLLVNNMLLVSILYVGLFTAGYFFLTNYILKKKLNLE